MSDPHPTRPSGPTVRGQADTHTEWERGIRDPEFNAESARQAFAKARNRASVAAAIEIETLHLAIARAREAGQSVRVTAAALNVPKSTVDRHWRPGHRCPDVRTVPGSVDEWTAAAREVFSHDERVPVAAFVLRHIGHVDGP